MAAQAEGVARRHVPRAKLELEATRIIEEAREATAALMAAGLIAPPEHEAVSDWP